MSQLPCKRFWKGPVGISLMPRKQHNGHYFWTFAFTRAFKRKGKETWEYTEFFGQKNAAALGTVMSQAMQFMEHNAPDEFTAKCMAENAAEDPCGTANQDAQAEGAASDTESVAADREATLDQTGLPPAGQVTH